MRHAAFVGFSVHLLLLCCIGSVLPVLLVLLVLLVLPGY